jgi:hypothetical protein
LGLGRMRLLVGDDGCGGGALSSELESELAETAGRSGCESSNNCGGWSGCVEPRGCGDNGLCREDGDVANVMDEVAADVDVGTAGASVFVVVVVVVVVVVAVGAARGTCASAVEAEEGGWEKMERLASCWRESSDLGNKRRASSNCRIVV